MKDKLKKILNYIIKFLKDNKVLLILNILIFVLTVLIHSLYVYKINSLLTYLIMLIYIIVPTVLAIIKFKLNKLNILITIVEFYIMFLLSMNYCTRYDLYGITNSTIDSLSPYVEALMVVFVFSAIEYITFKITNMLKEEKKVKKENNKKNK